MGGKNSKSKDKGKNAEKSNNVIGVRLAFVGLQGVGAFVKPKAHFFPTTTRTSKKKKKKTPAHCCLLLQPLAIFIIKFYTLCCMQSGNSVERIINHLLCSPSQRIVMDV